MYHYWYAIGMKTPILDVYFFETDTSNEPVREWLRKLKATDKKVIGEDLKTIQFSWPLGMQLARLKELGNKESVISLFPRKNLLQLLFFKLFP